MVMTKEKWSEHEEDVLIRYYPTHTNALIGELLDRSHRSVQGKAQDMGLHKLQRTGLVGFGHHISSLPCDDDGYIPLPVTQVYDLPAGGNKVTELARRYAAGEALWSELDCQLVDLNYVYAKAKP